MARDRDASVRRSPPTVSAELVSSPRNVSRAGPASPPEGERSARPVGAGQKNDAAGPARSNSARREHRRARALLLEPPRLELQPAIGEVEVLVVVSDDEDGFAAGLQVGQELGVEDVFVGGVLVGSPLVEDVDGAVFEVGDEQGQAFLLAA